ncbi:conserved hypothetical protein [Coccidioides posadasii str. Silveira]|uniref:Uncharacterized protein n=1 Tax=Coccidioides posadasii (strain RMSCC 757 / Silveira) TaxID=443226 RepID=E9CTZ6_COCPS|nr:conserved hypothetical protein [Coccidioides posadasii str. Silveira]
MFGLSRFAPTLRTASLRRAFSASTSRSHATITIAGPLGAAPELKTSQNGRQYIRYIAEKSQNYLLGLEKGTIMHVEGEPSITSLETPEARRSITLTLCSGDTRSLAVPDSDSPKMPNKISPVNRASPQSMTSPPNMTNPRNKRPIRSRILNRNMPFRALSPHMYWIFL